MDERKPGRGRGWGIHGAVLAVMFAIYGWLFRNVWGGGTPFGPHSETFALFCLVVLGGYAVVTTLVVAFVGRTWQVPLGMHGLTFAAAGALLLMELVPSWAAEGERSAIAADEATLAGCLAVDNVRVSPGTLMTATMAITSQCTDTIHLGHVWLMATDKEGGARSMRNLKPRTDVARGQTVHVLVDPIGEPSTKTHDAEGWSWRLTLHVEGPRPVQVCFATPDEHAPECAPLEGVEVVHGRKP